MQPQPLRCRSQAVDTSVARDFAIVKAVEIETLTSHRTEIVARVHRMIHVARGIDSNRRTEPRKIDILDRKPDVRTAVILHAYVGRMTDLNRIAPHRTDQIVTNLAVRLPRRARIRVRPDGVP